MASVRPETKFKQDLVKQVRDRGGYARRLEDQFAVGLPDLIIIPCGGPVFFVEAKIIRSNTWGPTPRQKLELERINATGAAVGCVVGLADDGGYVVKTPGGTVELKYKEGTSIIEYLTVWSDYVRQSRNS